MRLNRRREMHVQARREVLLIFSETENRSAFAFVNDHNARGEPRHGSHNAQNQETAGAKTRSTSATAATAATAPASLLGS